MGFCCERLAQEVEDHGSFAGGGFLYPPEMHPTGQIEQLDDGTWAVNGCCGGGCYVITDMRFCPFCGTQLPSEPRDDRDDAVDRAIGDLSRLRRAHLEIFDQEIADLYKMLESSELLPAQEHSIRLRIKEKEASRDALPRP